MAGFTISVFSLAWAVLIIGLAICGIWVFFAIRRSFAPVLIFDLIYLTMLEVLCLGAIFDPQNNAELPFYLITFVTFLLNTALTLVIFTEWRNAPQRMNEYVWWLKIALAITGVYTIIPLGFYYLKLSYLPRHPQKKRMEDAPAAISQDYPYTGLPGPTVPGGSLPEGPDAPPTLLQGRYHDWRFLGQGGFARVFKVTRKDGAVAALKVPLLHDEKTGQTFTAELVNWTGLRHENIVQVLEYNVLPVPYFEMEYCESSLAHRRKPLEPLAAAEIVYEVSRGLSYCHARGIVHLDIKPSNILIRDDTYKISDWGLSRVITESSVTLSQVWFTPQYAAPEQVLGSHKDPRTDIWQAGAIFSELLTGTPPFPGTSIVEIMAAVTTRDPQPPSATVPEAAPLDPIILRCLRRDPADRYADARELKGAIAGYLKQEYADRLSRCIAAKDEPCAEWYCSHLLLLAIREDDLPGAYRTASELLTYTPWLRRSDVQTLMTRVSDAMGDPSRADMEDLVKQAKAIIAQLRMEREAS